MWYWTTAEEEEFVSSALDRIVGQEIKKLEAEEARQRAEAELAADDLRSQEALQAEIDADPFHAERDGESIGLRSIFPRIVKRMGGKAERKYDPTSGWVLQARIPFRKLMPLTWRPAPKTPQRVADVDDVDLVITMSTDQDVFIDSLVNGRTVEISRAELAQNSDDNWVLETSGMWPGGKTIPWTSEEDVIDQLSRELIERVVAYIDWAC